jgi:pyruvate kinase
MKRTKIVATMGPASKDHEVMKQMIQEGVNVIRLNFSHGSHDAYREIINTVRKIDEEIESCTAILADLQGPKLRIGELPEEGVELIPGKEIIISTSQESYSEGVLTTNYSSFAKDVKGGERVLLDDGKISLKVLETDGKSEVKLIIIYGGILTSKKGINLPNTKISLPSLTPKDLTDLDFALEMDVDWIGLSFVRRAQDIIDLKKRISDKEKHSLVIAKIEKPEAVDAIEDVILHSDAIMVARGDLGVETPMQNVPLLQKRIIQLCINSAKPVIVATQMMESMIESPTPTRAEVNDVANAVLDRADAVMLSAETSVGAYPILVIKAMAKIINEVEKTEEVYYHEQIPVQSEEDRFITDSICYNACRLAKRTNAKAIITMTFSGYTAFKVSSQRPRALTFVFTGNKKILTMMNLVWGVKSFYYDKMVSTDHTIADIKYILKRGGYVKEGDFIINVASIPIAEHGMSNMVKLSKA